MKSLEKLAETDKGLATELRIIRSGARAAGMMGYLSAMMWREEITESEYVYLCNKAINMAVGRGVQS